MRKMGILSFFGTALAAGAMMFSALPAGAQSKSTIRIAMTVSDIPTLTGAPSQGGEGHRFGGIPLYDALVNWNLRRSDVPAAIEPGLATEWHVEDADKTKWIFKLRKGVKFHDGSTFNADAVIFSLRRLRDKNAPYFDPKGAAELRARIPGVKDIKKIDDYTVEVSTPEIDSQLPYQLTWFLIVSPAQFEKVGKDWAKFGSHPSGTGPFKLEKLVPRDRAVLVPFADYWDKKRIAKSTIILRPIPEAATRTAALLSGEVDWVEAPSPDTIPRLKSAGMQIVTNTYPHIWPYTVSMLDASPFHDIRIRKAVNLAINRDGLVKLLGGMAEPSYGEVNPGNPWYGHPTFKISLRPRGGEAAPERGGLRTGSSAQAQGRDIDQRLGANAASADERVHSAEPEGSRH